MTPFALEIARELLEFAIHEDCDGAVKSGIERFRARLTTRHSLTSTSPSLWALARRSLDQPVRDLLAEHEGYYEPHDLDGFLPSRITRVPPQLDRRDTDYAVRNWSRAGHDKKTEQALINIGLWDLRLHAVIRRYHDDTSEPSRLRNPRLVETLDSLRQLLEALSVMLPASMPLESRKMRQRSEVIREFSEPQPYCDLCWRYTVRYAALNLSGFQAQSAPGNLSPRYCEYHLPIENPPGHNCYRSDNRYREAFHDELWALLGRQRSKYVFRLQPPRNADTQEVRKAAYDTVHCGVRPLRSIHERDEFFAERVWRLHLAGSAQADIARRLSVHRQAVSRTLKRLKEIAARQAIDAEIDPSTGEMFSLHSDATRPLFDTVRACRATGASTAEIAQSVGRFKQTVKSVQRWLSVIDAIESAQRQGIALRTVAARFRLSIELIDSLANRFAHKPGRHGHELARAHEREFRFVDPAPEETAPTLAGVVFVRKEYRRQPRR